MNPYLLLAAIIGGLFLFGAGYVKGKSDCSVRSENTNLKATVKEHNENESYRNKIRKIGDAELVKRYCASSVFDVSADQCVASNPLLP